MLGALKRIGSESVQIEGRSDPHAPARRRREKPEDDVDDEPRVPRHALALDANAWLTTLRVDAPMLTVASSGAGVAQSAAVPVPEDLQNLITALARRVAWGGDRRRGSARIELSEGPLAGATLLVHAEAREVSVELELPSGSAAAGEWRERLIQRLEERGFVARVRVE